MCAQPRSARPLAAAMLPLLLAGCQWGTTSPAARYETVPPDPHRNSVLAQEKNAKAVQLLQHDQLDQAEKELQAALAADLFFGPAHNNLGVVYYRRQKHYLAAWEFQYASRLMPRKAEPRNNLGMVFEAVGRLDDAAKWYEEALQIDPDAPEVAGNLARILVRKNVNDAKTRKLLQDVVMKDDRPEWVEWARQRLALMGPAPQATQPATSAPKE